MEGISGLPIKKKLDIFPTIVVRDQELPPLKELLFDLFFGRFIEISRTDSSVSQLDSERALTSLP